MAQIVAGIASSHAFTFLDMEHWDERRRWGRERYAQKWGKEAPVLPEVERESPEDNRLRLAHIRESLGTVRARLAEARPDVLIVVGDDQDENFTDENLPQFAIYVGDEAIAVERFSGARVRYPCDAALARTILNASVDAGFDLSFSKAFPNGELKSHAHQQPIMFLDPEGRLPIVPIFVNAFHPPAPSPARCYQFGQQLRTILEAVPNDKRVALYASGGLSHFVASYPWDLYTGPWTYGQISQDFDRRFLAQVGQGRGAEAARLTSQDLFDNGDIELRSWIILLGALGARRPEWHVYEPFYRGMMGMGVAYWDLEQAAGADARPATVAANR
jgi:hypothetical protein